MTYFYCCCRNAPLRINNEVKEKKMLIIIRKQCLNETNIQALTHTCMQKENADINLISMNHQVAALI